MSEESSSLREPDDAMARQSGAVSEDVQQPLTTDEDAENTARGSLQGTAGPEGADPPENLTTD